MDSNRKAHEYEDSAVQEKIEFASKQAVIALKIQQEIRRYTLRKLLAQDDIANISKLIRTESDNEDMLSLWRTWLVDLHDEVSFCSSQLLAYRNKDEKSKVIPDRLL